MAKDLIFMINLILLLSCGLFQASFAVSWTELLSVRLTADDKASDLIKRQHQSALDNCIPRIADAYIKQIPIKENHEELVDIATCGNLRISIMSEAELLLAHDFPGDIDPRSPRYSLVRKSVYEALERMIDELDVLAPEFGYKKGCLQIKLFEGLRDLAMQKQLFDEKMASILKEHPGISQQDAYNETCKWLSPYINNVPVHSTGAAVDIHLWNDETKSFCYMGRFNTSGVTAPMFSEDGKVSDEQKKNRLLFLIAATRAGLTNYPNEFWHYSLGDRYAAYWRESNVEFRCSVYGAIE